jgi:hypothetical protein
VTAILTIGGESYAVTRTGVIAPPLQASILLTLAHPDSAQQAASR